MVKRLLYLIIILSLPVVMVAQADVDSLFRVVEQGGRAQRAEAARQIVRTFEQEDMYDYPVPEIRHNDHKFNEMLAYLGMGLHTLDNGDYPRAAEMGRKAEQLAPKDSLRWLSSCYELLDAAYLWQGDYPKCIEYAQKDYDAGERLGDDHIRSTALNALAAAHCYTRLYDQALAYSNRAVAIERGTGDDKALAVRLGIKCEILLLMGRPDEALETIEEAIEIDRKAGREEKVAIRLSQKADILADQGKYEECYNACTQALAIFEKTGNVKEQIIVLKQLGACETYLKQYAAAEAHLLESERLCLETGFRSQLWRVRKHMSKLYKETGRLERAMEYLELSTALCDSLNEARQQTVIAEYQARFEVQEKERELEAQRNAIHNRNILAIAGGVIAVLASLIAVFGYRLAKTRKRRNQELETANLVKDRFFTIISHDLKNPVKAQSQLLASLSSHYDEVDDTAKKQQILALKESGDRLSELLTNLLDWARLETGQMGNIPMRIDIAAVTRKTVQLLQTAADEKGVTITSDLDAPCHVFTDHNAAETILRNLLSNAVKFSHPGGTIEITSEKTADTVAVTITDHGLGMTEAQKDSVFQMRKLTTLGTKEETGTGLGLIVCKTLADLSRCGLSFTTADGSGTAFTLTLPASESAYDKR